MDECDVPPVRIIRAPALRRAGVVAARDRFGLLLRARHEPAQVKLIVLAEMVQHQPGFRCRIAAVRLADEGRFRRCWRLHERLDGKALPVCNRRLHREGCTIALEY